MVDHSGGRKCFIFVSPPGYGIDHFWGSKFGKGIKLTRSMSSGADLPADLENDINFGGTCERNARKTDFSSFFGRPEKKYHTF